MSYRPIRTECSLLKTQCKARQAQAWSVNWAKFCLASLSSPGWNSALLSLALWLVAAKSVVFSDWSPPNRRKFPKNNHSTLSILQKVKLASLFCGKNDETCWPSYLGGCTSPTTGYVNLFTKKRPKIWFCLPFLWKHMIKDESNLDQDLINRKASIKNKFD